jgi:3-dehydroquinate synthetase
MRHMQDLNVLPLDPVKDQVAAKGAAPDSAMFKPGDKGKSARHVGNAFARLGDLQHKRHSAFPVVGGDVISNVLQIGKSRSRPNNPHGFG